MPGKVCDCVLPRRSDCEQLGFPSGCYHKKTDNAVTEATVRTMMRMFATQDVLHAAEDLAVRLRRERPEMNIHECELVSAVDRLRDSRR